jgi:pyruvate, water dikinase
MSSTTYILNLKQVGLDDIAVAGGKNASLGEMINNLSQLGIRIPGGFVITVAAYRKFIEVNKLDQEIRRHIESIDFNNVESLRRAGLQIRQLIRNSKFPPELSSVIIEQYRLLSGEYGQPDTDVAVRSSATAEDLPDASFAGQQETYLNVRGQLEIVLLRCLPIGQSVTVIVLTMIISCLDYRFAYRKWYAQTLDLPGLLFLSILNPGSGM